MDPLPRLCVLTLLIGILAVTNLRGVRAGAELSNIFTVAKLVPLFLVPIAGAVYALNHQPMSNATATSAGAHSWLQPILIPGFAYGGFQVGRTATSQAT